MPVMPVQKFHADIMHWAGRIMFTRIERKNPKKTTGVFFSDENYNNSSKNNSSSNNLSE